MPISAAARTAAMPVHARYFYARAAYLKINLPHKVGTIIAISKCNDHNGDHSSTIVLAIVLGSQTTFSPPRRLDGISACRARANG